MSIPILPVRAGRKRQTDQAEIDSHSPAGKQYCPQPLPQKGAKRSCVKLVVQSSQVKATYGAGLGLFAAGNRGETVFAKDVTLINIKGALVFLQTKDDQSIGWMVNDTHYSGLSSDHLVIRSDVRLTVPDEGEVELGVRPDDLSQYINDSRSDKNANAQVEVDYESYLNGHVVHEPITAREDLPVCSVIATRDIMAGEEIMWYYHCKSRQYTSQIEAFEECHKAQAQQCNQRILGAKLQFVASPMVFDEQRWLAARPSLPLDIKFSAQEEKVRATLDEGNHITAAVVLRKAEKNKTYLRGYLKTKLNRVTNLEYVLSCLRTVFRRKTRGGSALNSVNKIYDFCIVNNIFKPSDNSYVPIGWLATKLQQAPESPEYQKVLRRRLETALIPRKFSMPIFLKNLHYFGVPNLVAPGQKWTVMHMESLTGCIANLPRDPADVQDALNNYTRTEAVTELPVLSQTLYEMIKRGSVDALKAVLEKRLSRNNSQLTTLAREMLDCQLSAVLQGERKPLSADVLIEFIQVHFDNAGQRRLLGINAICSMDELLENIRLADPLDTSYKKIFWKKYHQNPSKDLLRPILVIQCQRKDASRYRCYPCDLIKVLNGADVKTPDGRCYNRAELYQLLKDEQDPAVRKVFIENNTDETVIDMATRRHPSADFAREAMTRSSQSVSFLKRYLKDAATKTAYKSMDQFFESKAQHLNSKGVLHPETREYWTMESLREYTPKTHIRK